MPGPSLAPGVRTRLSAMMFLQYAFQGIFIIPLNNYLTKTAHYTFGEAGTIFGTVALGFIIAPFFVGMIADRFFSAQKVLGVLNIAAAVLLYVASQLAMGPNGVKQPWVLFWVLLAHNICYAPTWALTNTIALNQMTDPGKQFPGVRVIGTFGWITVSVVSLVGAFQGYPGFVTFCEGAGTMGRWFLAASKSVANWEFTNLPMIVGACIGAVAGLLSFAMPATPPKSIGHRPTFSDIIGTKALVLFKDRNFLVFALCSFLILLPNMFFWGFCNAYLNEIHMEAPQFKQSIGQMAEVVFLYLMPVFFIRWGVKTMLTVGFLAWMIRFVCFAFGYQTLTFWGTAYSMAPLLYMGIALHGVCFDFFFVTGQLYTDKKAPKEIQASAQGLITLITFGLGWLAGSKLAGWVIDCHVTARDAAGNATMHDWQTIWLVPAVMAGVLLFTFLGGFRILLILMEGFHDKMLVVEKESKPQ
jgi:nucleoside transporter